MAKQNQKHKMTIWLSNTEVGRAIYYLDKNMDKNVMCPIIETGCGDDPPILYFYPQEYDDLAEAFEQRINNPNNNKSFSTGADFARCGCEAKPLPVRIKKLDKPETESFLCLERRIRNKFPEGIVFYAPSDEDFLDLKDISNIKERLTSLVTSLEFLEEFNKLYDCYYKSSEWVGNSAKAEEFYKRRALK